MVHMDPEQLFDRNGTVLVMRKRVVLIGNADFGVSPAATFVFHREGDDAGQVGLVSQHLQIHH